MRRRTSPCELRARPKRARHSLRRWRARFVGPHQIRLDISYDGTNFSGWARQPGIRTVCGVLEERFLHGAPSTGRADGRRTNRRRSARDRSGCTLRRRGCAGRARPVGSTDGAVPARPTSGCVRSRRSRPTSTLGSRHIAVTTSTDSAQRSTASILWTSPESCPWPRPIDLDAVREASQALIGLHDFAAFCKRRDGATTVRELQRFDWEREGDRLTAYVSADAFCWSMVRTLVGAMQAVGEGRRDLAWVRGLLSSDSRSSSITVAPLMDCPWSASTTRHRIGWRNATYDASDAVDARRPPRLISAVWHQFSA